LWGGSLSINATRIISDSPTTKNGLAQRLTLNGKRLNFKQRD
jgi:hypothetical protein